MATDYFAEIQRVSGGVDHQRLIVCLQVFVDAWNECDCRFSQKHIAAKTKTNSTLGVSLSRRPVTRFQLVCLVSLPIVQLDHRKAISAFASVTPSLWRLADDRRVNRHRICLHCGENSPSFRMSVCRRWKAT